MTDNNLHEVIVTRIFDAPIEEIWSYWNDAEKFKKWWGPDNFDCPTAKLDFREGGKSLVSMESKQFGFPEQFSILEYTKIVPMELIEYVHNMADKDGNKIDPTTIGMPADFPQDVKTVAIFKERDGKTEMTVTEYMPADTSMLENAEKGLNQSIDKMVKAVKNR